MKEEDLFDLTLKVVRARGARKMCEKGARKIKGIQPYESQGERTISIDYDEQQARISIIIHHLIFDALQNGNGTNEEILFTIN